MQFKNKKRLFRLMIVLCLVFGGLFTSVASVSAAKTYSVNVGKTKQLRLKGTSATVTWKSTKPSVATISSTGLVKGLKKGTTTIKAYVGKKYYACTVEVKQPVTKIALDKTSYILMPQKTVTLKATVSPSNANTKKLSWSSSNKSVATVSASGVVTGVKNGTATITAKATDGSGVKATCKITVLKNSTTTTTTTTIVSADGASAKAKAFLKVVDKYSKYVQKEVAAGTAWWYSQKKVPKTFEDAIANNKRYTTCSWMVTWALKDSTVGVLEYKGNLSCNLDGSIFYGSGGNTKESIQKNCEVIKVNQSVSSLAKAGKLVPGDILIYPGHVNVFAGYDKKTGVTTYYDSGRGSMNGAYKGGTFYFKTFGPHKTTGSIGTASYVIRIK